ncbi:type II toxin-antitoxin system PemK/MazF family toxin [Haloterrigena alkaliphila]|uniref:Type II toxin-antitoxin system PemK/MazF family toxin n=1 Tax=Haloterrigena alkaliphila TaxID=2816475 RepID=A0A8A2VC67_9EURY|nr:type II toxin-antitoxin system PemK/MazF family toxin [Haloterrigena alkaliphila]QSW99633.1 type II toxin-antitoxin system PemK/MazF family toxin [Haloterrigena alkaliphila]
MTHARGTIVLADDPFKGEGTSRPWLIVGTDEAPFHGEQYIALTLSTKTWYDERVPLDADDIVDGGLPKDSSILPWAVASVDATKIDRELATLDERVVDEVVGRLGSYIGIERY